MWIPRPSALSGQLGSACPVPGTAQAIVPASGWGQMHPEFLGVCLHQRFVRKHVLEEVALT